MTRIYNITKYIAVGAIVFGFVFSFSAIAKADSGTYSSLNNQTPDSLVCGALSRVGLGCWNLSSSSTTATSQNSSNNTSLFSGLFGTNSSTSGNSNTGNSSLGATIYTGTIKKTYSDNEITLVKVANSPQIYEITKGQKHLIPTNEIFADYGYKPEMVQTITQAQLDKYPRMKLLQVNGDSKHYYYLTEAGLVRLVPDVKVLDSYGDNKNDAITISKKEFNYYPQNTFVFLETPLNRDVFEVLNGVKRYLTPMAVARMGLRNDQIAPVNQFELDYYKTGAPIVN